MTSTTQQVINWSRFFIPDPKLRNASVRNEDIGQTSTPTGDRETFYLKHSPVGSIFIYIEPYTYSAVSSLKSASTLAKVFMWGGATTLACIFSDGTIDKAHKPKKFKPVLAFYEYNEKLPYAFSDTELISFLPAAIAYLNNTYNFSYSYTGSGDLLNVLVSSDSDRELIAKALAIVTRRSYLDEQKRRGLGIRFRGPMQSIDSVQQMKDYQEGTKALEEQLQAYVDRTKLSGLTGQVIDIYSEDIVET